MLIVELTESLTLSQLDVVDEVLGALREAGIMLALDDFGTGYSSLATLARVPVHELKIDRSFVAAMDSPAEAAVVRSTVELGRSLDLLVVAEGVESEEQRRRLWEPGCPAGQGHLFARPTSADNLLSALKRGFGGRPAAIAAAELRDTPYEWALVPGAIASDRAAALVDTFPVDDFWRLRHDDGEKSYTYSARPLVILGEGEERGRLEALASDLGIAAAVTLPGYVGDARRFLRTGSGARFPGTATPAPRSSSAHCWRSAGRWPACR